MLTSLYRTLKRPRRRLRRSRLRRPRRRILRRLPPVPQHQTEVPLPRMATRLLMRLLRRSRTPAWRRPRARRLPPLKQIPSAAKAISPDMVDKSATLGHRQTDKHPHTPTHLPTYTQTSTKVETRAYGISFFRNLSLIPPRHDRTFFLLVPINMQS